MESQYHLKNMRIHANHWTAEERVPSFNLASVGRTCHQITPISGVSKGPTSAKMTASAAK